MRGVGVGRNLLVRLYPIRLVLPSYRPRRPRRRSFRRRWGRTPFDRFRGASNESGTTLLAQVVWNGIFEREDRFSHLRESSLAEDDQKTGLSTGTISDNDQFSPLRHLALDLIRRR